VEGKKVRRPEVNEREKKKKKSEKKPGRGKERAVTREDQISITNKSSKERKKSCLFLLKN